MENYRKCQLENQRTSQLENWITSPYFPSFPCSACYPCSPNLLHVLQSGIAGFNEFCRPGAISSGQRKVLLSHPKTLQSFFLPFCQKSPPAALLFAEAGCSFPLLGAAGVLRLQPASLPAAAALRSHCCQEVTVESSRALRVPP